MAPKAFISYSWDDESHKDWVHELATRLRADGVDVTLDRWAAVPGDQLPAFMETAIRENQFVIIVCTPRYKTRSNAREGGVGYEGDIMTAEAMNRQNNRKFIPVFRAGSWQEAAPTWLAGKYYINLSGPSYSEEQYADLVRTILGIRETAPPLGKAMSTVATRPPKLGSVRALEPPKSVSAAFDDIKVTRVIVEEITEPRNDGTAGSALYAIPFALSRRPALEWEQLFCGNWNHPPRFTSMHRPGIARVNGSTVTLDGTTIEEVRQYHRETLQLAVEETNKQYREFLRRRDELKAREQAKRDQHYRSIQNALDDIKFD